MSALSILAEECELLTDSKYRSYITQVEKALKSFEYTSEWADLISALGKLNKALISHSKYPVIPKRVTIGKRLAQCLHPALPSGVHLKALETYDIIFRCIGTQRFAQDLFIYTAGLFPLLGHAAISVKPVLLAIYENHFVVLGKQIKPALNGLILGLLPGLEEGSEFCDRTNRLFDDFCDATDPVYFYTCLWESIHSCPSIRLPAITFFLSHFNKRQSMEDQIFMMGLNIDLMVESLCSAINDDNILVQRCVLDFLLTAFPMHNGQLTKGDVGKIVKAAIDVVLRRDMSLNRRLYAWLLGMDTSGSSAGSSSRRQRNDSVRSASSETDLTYFQTFSKDLLILAIKFKLRQSAKVEKEKSIGMKSALKPFRILISLLDKPEIGPTILENVLLAVFQCLYREYEKVNFTKPSKNFDIGNEQRNREIGNTEKMYNELVKTANLLFSTFEPYFIWDFCGRMFELSCQNTQLGKASLKIARQSSFQQDNEKLKRQNSGQMESDSLSITDLCYIIVFLLDIVSLDTLIETQTEHLPELLRCITTCLTNYHDQLSDLEITSALQLCTKLLAKVQPSMTAVGSDSSGERGSFQSDIPVLETSSPSNSVIDVTNVSSASEKNSLFLDQVDNIQSGEKMDSIESIVKNTREDQKSVNGGENPDSVKSSSENDLSNLVQCPREDLLSTGGHEEKNSLSSCSEYGGNVVTIANSAEACDIENMCKLTNINTEPPSMSTSSSLRNNLDCLPEKESNVSVPIMQTCIQCFQNFFHSYVTKQIFQGSDLAARCMESVTVLTNTVDYTEGNLVSDSSSVGSHEDLSQKDFSQLIENLSISATHLKSEGLSAFMCACKLLVDFASFPVYCSDYSSIFNQKADGSVLPLWLKDLITCTSFVDSFIVRSSAISTMLDLIILAQSVQSAMIHQQATPGQPIPMAILPALMPQHLCYLNKHLHFYKLVATILWNYLSETESVCHQRSVELFHFLHQVTPSSWVCEDVIGQDLISDYQAKRIEAYEKFTVLWHLTRDKRTDVTPGQPLRTFDRSMFVVLDSLKEEMSSMKTIASTWLTHVVERGDINRVLEPMLLMLLHPDTARVSIQHVNIHQPQHVQLPEEEDQSSEARIYAISSEGGNVIYHVGSGDKFSPRSMEELKSVALTVMTDKGSLKTEQVKSLTEQEMPFERVNPDDLNLRINPFGSQSSLDRLIFDGYEFPFISPPADLVNVRRLDKDICAKEGIYFDEEDKGLIENKGLKDEVQEKNCEEIVSSVLEDIIDNVYAKTNLNALEQTDKQKHAQRPQRLESVSSRTSSNMCDQDILNAIDKHGMSMDSPTSSEIDMANTFKSDSAENFVDIHPLHMHLLLYAQKYDYQRTLYSLSTLRAMLLSCPRLIVTAIVTTSISSFRTPQLAKLQSLLARHRKSVFGKNFFGEIPPDAVSGYRSSMFVEIIISVVLYFIRGYYPNLMMSKMSSEELHGNKEVHIVSTEVLTLLTSELISIMKQSGKNFMSYIQDLLSRCKMQKAILHCALATVYNSRHRNDDDKSCKITEAIVSFNEANLDHSLNETFQIRLLNLLLVLIMLENQCEKLQTDTDSGGTKESTDTWERPRINFQMSLLNVRFNSNLPIIQQSMFVSCVISALKQFHMCHMHRHWIKLVTSALPYMGTALPSVVGSVVTQLCRNLEALAAEYEAEGKKSPASLKRTPPDHTVMILEALTTVCHYCLLDTVPQVSIGQQTPTGTPVVLEQANTGHIFSNLMHVFNPAATSRESSPQRDMGPMSPVLEARRLLLSILPRIISCMAVLWKAIRVESQGSDSQIDHPCWTMGSPKVLKFYILEFLSPISFAHGTNLLGSLAVAWNDRRKKLAPLMKKVIPMPCEDQLLLVDLVNAMKILPIDTVIQTVKQVVKQPPLSDLGKGKKSVSLEVNMLQFFYAYVQQASPSQLADSWPSLLTLLKEVLQMNISQPGQFLLLEVLNEYVQRIPAMDDKKNQKELQDISQKLLETVGKMGGSSLEQTTWLRRNMAVKPGPQRDITETEHDDEQITENIADIMNTVEERKVLEPQMNSQIDSKYSVQALTLLAEVTAPLLDVVYSSDEKDKAIPFLVSLLTNVFPYLRNHSCHNLPSFRASSQILSSISGYQYTRKAWRKEALELFLDPCFFQMDIKCVGYWHNVIDNLMTHDKTTFKDLMTRVTMTQSGSLNLFSSKEQEFEQRAQMLKRLAFTIFCSDPDQYQKSIPDIQERLAESLRLPHVPSVIAQVFLCFRVLLLRMSPQHLTSMWPTIITEMVHVCLQIEQEMSTETDEFKLQLQRIAALDSSWAHLGNGLNAHNNPAWLQLYLSVCKLLDLALSLPADMVPQFQLYRWAFIGGVAAGDDETGNVDREMMVKPKFIPHVIRLAKLINSKLHVESPILKQTLGRPLITFTHLRSLAELQPFFNTLCCAIQSDNVHVIDQCKHRRDASLKKSSESRKKFIPKSKSAPAIDDLYNSLSWQSGLQDKTDIQYIEELLRRDFLDLLPN